jgi:hypothetical protein
MTSPGSVALANLARIGQLKTEAPDARERAGLLRSATVRLHDARQTTLSIESRFDLGTGNATWLSTRANSMSPKASSWSSSNMPRI